MLRISYCIVARQMAAVAVTSEVEISDVSNGDPPSLNMLDKVVDTFIWCRVLLKILRSITPTVARMVKQVKGEVLLESGEQLVEGRCRAAISVREDQFWLRRVWVSDDDRAYKVWQIVVESDACSLAAYALLGDSCERHDII